MTDKGGEENIVMEEVYKDCMKGTPGNQIPYQQEYDKMKKQMEEIEKAIRATFKDCKLNESLV